MLDYSEWEMVYEDSELDVRIDPQESEGYGVSIKGSEEYLFFPRGTLKEVALANRDRGKSILENLMPHTLKRGEIFKGQKLTLDSIIAVVTKAYWIEEETYRREDDLPF